MKRFIVVLSAVFWASAIFAQPTLPNINTNNVLAITNVVYGGSIASADNAAAIQSAINAANTGGNTNGLLGGIVRVPPGVFLSGPLTLKNNVALQLDDGAVLRLLPYGTYPGAPYTVSVSSFISGSSLTNIAVMGGGLIDGQGADWWNAIGTNAAVKRPNHITLTSCSRVLLQNFTSSNPPSPHISVKGNNAGNVTFRGIILRAPASSPNTDGVDIAETNVLFQDCVIDSGDDNIAIGSSAGLSRDILVTNCTFLAGHGLSIGSFTSSGVSNLTVVNCTWNGTDNGIRLKSQRDRGGLVQNLNYLNLTMTNVSWPFLIYSYYEFGLGTITPANSAYAASVTATDTVNTVTATTPIFRNITFSNITAYANNTRPALMIWGLPQMSVSNVLFKNITLSAAKIACLFNAQGIQFVDSRLNFSAATNGFDLFNAGVVFSNTVFTNTLNTFTGVTTNGLDNVITLANANGTLRNTNLLEGGALTLAGGTFTVSNGFSLAYASAVNFALGTNFSRLAVTGNLVLGGTNNFFAASGFTNGSYTVMTATGAVSGSLPMLGNVPAGYAYSWDTNTTGQVKLIVTLLAPTNLIAAPTNLQINLRWSSVVGATNYSLKRGSSNSGPYPFIINTAATNYADANVTNGGNYFYVVSASGAGGESANSIQASATSLPSNQPTNLTFQAVGNQLQLAWPSSHLGWRLQIQTNSLGLGLSTNWTTVPNSSNLTTVTIPMVVTNGSVFLRLVYP